MGDACRLRVKVDGYEEPSVNMFWSLVVVERLAVVVTPTVLRSYYLSWLPLPLTDNYSQVGSFSQVHPIDHHHHLI
jgi:hypothetical protein